MEFLIVGAVALLLVAGWCTSAETALLRVSVAGARKLSRSAGKAGERLAQALTEAPRYLAVVLLARVAAEVCAAVAVAAFLVHLLGFGWQPFLITAAVMTAASYLLAGVIPRNVGRNSPVRVATGAAAVLRPAVALLGPLPRLLAAAGPAARDDDESGPEEDLRGLVDLLEQRQLIEPGERAMIHSVFELGDTIVREVMVPRTDMVYVEHDHSLHEALSLALRSGFSRIPVTGENLDDVVGIAYLKDVITRVHEDSAGESAEAVESVMRPATFQPESKPVDDLLREMQARHVHMAIVIDEYGGTAGLVTIEDILEEIVGEIEDEYDTERPPVEWLEGGSARVSARLPVEELAELFGVTVEAEDVETVAGLLAHKLGKVPIPGSTATVAGLRLTAENLTGRRNRIGTVTVQRLDGPGDRHDDDDHDGRQEHGQPHWHEEDRGPAGEEEDHGGLASQAPPPELAPPHAASRTAVTQPDPARGGAHRARRREG